MSSAFSRLAVAFVALCLAGSAHARELSVCADPNNLPFSNANGQGFENKIAALLAAELGAELKYFWWAQRRGFVRNTLNAGECDLVTGSVLGAEMLRSTIPYYRSSYVFVTRADAPSIASLDDAALRDTRIGSGLITSVLSTEQTGGQRTPHNCSDVLINSQGHKFPFEITIDE